MSGGNFKCRIGFLQTSGNDGTNTDCKDLLLSNSEVIARLTDDTDTEILRTAKEMSEEIDVLVLGDGLEDTLELVRESIRIPVICLASVPQIIEEIYGSMRVPRIDPIQTSLLVAELIAKVGEGTKGGRMAGGRIGRRA